MQQSKISKIVKKMKILIRSKYGRMLIIAERISPHQSNLTKKQEKNVRKMQAANFLIGWFQNLEHGHISSVFFSRICDLQMY